MEGVARVDYLNQVTTKPSDWQVFKLFMDQWLEIELEQQRQGQTIWNRLLQMKDSR